MSLVLASVISMGVILGDPRVQDAQVAAVDQAELGAASDVLARLRGAYRQDGVLERISVATLSEGRVVRRSGLVLALRRTPSPALAFALGDSDPLRVIAEPGRLVAWRVSDPSRVFVSLLDDPFGREALERVLPPIWVPQIDLAFGDADSPLLGVLTDPVWSRLGDGQSNTYLGVADDASVSLRVGDDGRLSGFTIRQAGESVLRAQIEAGADGQSDGFRSMFEPPPLDRTLVRSISDLGRERRDLAPGMAFGDALGVDARRRPTSLRALADGATNVVVLAVDARSDEARTLIAGAFAEAELAAIAELLDARVIVLAVGEPRVAAVFQRVVRSTSALPQPVRVLALEETPDWLPRSAFDSGGLAYSIEGRSWMVRSVHRVPGALAGGGDPGGSLTLADSSRAPRPLAERIAEAVGAAARELR
ncbi:MAG: hypothetical protein HRU13_09190 [Phycisphaerales bacterium]|nr:hypothetical protein [Phycisphaerales bacterium]